MVQQSSPQLWNFKLAMNTLDIHSSFSDLHSSFHAGSQARTGKKQLLIAIWIYFLLILFDGALRKWFLPSLSNPILVLRDPIALWILIYASKKGFLKLNHYILLVVLIGFLAIYTAYFIGHGSLTVAIYGARIFLLHIPLIFVIQSVFDKTDIIKLARWTVLLCIPMIVLVVIQFYSPQTAWVNKSVGGEAGGGFSGALDYFRPPGTFSFTNGNTMYFNFAACFIIYFWFHAKEISRLVLLLSTFALLVCIPFSISRTLFFQLVITVLFAISSIMYKPKYLGGLILSIAGVLGLFVVLSFTPYFTNATAAFSSRFESANTIEGGLNGVFMDRFLGNLLGGLTSSSSQPFFGAGVGMGTNVGAMLLAGGKMFLIDEEEWGRIVGELGPILGLTIIFLRVQLAASIFFKSFSAMKKGLLLPWLLSSTGILMIAQGGWAQPTSLGFCVITTGLILASLKDSREGDNRSIAKT